MSGKCLKGLSVLGLLVSAASADVFQDYEDLDEGFLGQSLHYAGVNYRDVNTVSGVFPDGGTFNASDLGNELIIEDATLLYGDFPDYGSPNNSLTFGSAFVNGPNLSLGALASVWMDLDTPGTSASFDIAYYENGPWGGIEFHLDALSGGQVVASDLISISNLGGRDNVTTDTMNVSGLFDSLHFYATYNGEYSGPRALIDNLSITSVPEPASLTLLALTAAGLLKRRG